MKRNWTTVGAVTLGVGLMYLLDPEQGRGRRARLGDQMAASGRRFGRGVSVGARDARQRASGLAHEGRARLHHERVPDHVLVERVRARLGHLISHPHAIKVDAKDGRVTLSGPVLTEEHDRGLAGIARVRGVSTLEDRLEPHAAEDGVPGLQRGGLDRRAPRLLGSAEVWPPRWRLAFGAAGGLLLASGLARPRGLGSHAARLGGGLLLMRGLTNSPLRRITGAGAGRRAVDVEKVVNIHAPMDRVFSYFHELTNLPSFMSHVREVHDRGDGRYRWVVDGPAGVPVVWDAVVTRCVPGEILAWKSEPGSAVESAGVVTFRPNDDGGTRVQVRLSYNPIVGLLGHGVARLFRVDPKRQLDDDLARMKTYLETGTAPHDAARPVKGQFYH